MSDRRWPALALALISGAASAGHFTFTDWEVACDNTRHCEAVGYQAEGDTPAVLLWLGRDAGPTAPVSARISVQSEDDGAAGPLTLQVGPAIVRGLRADDLLKAEQVARLLPLLVNAESATVADGKHTWTLSLAGMKAALLKMDEVQGRVGTATVLARPGVRSADRSAVRPIASVLAPVAPPRIQQLPTFAYRAADAGLLPLILKTIAHGGCEDGFDAGGGEPYNEIHRLSATQVLLLLECSRGAYQSSYEAWMANDQPPYAARPVTLPFDTAGLGGYLMNPGFANGQLTSLGKGRGINDCNEQATYAWTAAGFRLVQASSGQLCRGFPGGYPLRDYTATVIQPAVR